MARHGWNRCLGKRRFTDPAEAKASAVTLSRRFRRTLEAYRCYLCGGLHVGKRRGSTGKKW